MLDLPTQLTSDIQDGRVVLFLGSGASIGAIHPEGKQPPVGDELGKLIADKFLSAKLRNRPLAQVSELAINESDLLQVQEFIASIFEKFDPAEFHKIIPKFHWKALATTNYDLIVERAYQVTRNPLQTPVVFLKNGDRVDSKIQDSKSLVFYKLHGCITDISNPDVPLILTGDQYISHLSGRSRLFSRLIELFYEYPFVFVGHSLADPDIRAILAKLEPVGTARPRAFLVSPNMTPEEARFFESKRITHISATFEEFLHAANSSIPAQFRGLSVLIDPSEHPIAKKLSLSRGNDPSPSLMSLITRDVDYLHSGISPTALNPKSFYKGYFTDWTPIINNLDIERRLSNTMLSEIIIASLDRAKKMPELYILKGHAGSGKSVVLRRVAWDAAMDLDALCLWHNPGCMLSFEALAELYRLSEERIFLFIDPVADSIQMVMDLMIRSRKSSIPLTIIGGERQHEWNTDCTDLEPFVNDSYELHNLSEKEIRELLGKLEKHGSLGYLDGLSEADQIDNLRVHAGRQLLVALHEATLGKPFSDIVFDEYNSISSSSAQSLYLTVCIFHRLGVPVRAGLIARVHGIPFHLFKEKMYDPLELVVFDYFDHRIQDQVYRSRHSHIAEIVFERVLRNPQDRFDEYVRVLGSIDYDFYSDRRAFRGITKARELISLFPNPQMIRDLYRISKDQVGEEPWLLQQEAIFEMNSKDGSVHSAQKILDLAYQIDGRDRSILHSLAELALKKSLESESDAQKKAYRQEARKHARQIINQHGLTPFPYHTLIKVDLSELADLLVEGDTPSIERSVKTIEELIKKAIQLFPEDSFLASAEADFSQLLLKDARVLTALERANRSNPQSEFIALRLARIYEEDVKLTQAINVLEKCVDLVHSSKLVNYHLAQLYVKSGSHNVTQILHHLRRSFTKGDANYRSQFEYARLLYINGSTDDAMELFQQLGNAHLDNRTKIRPRGVQTGPDGNPQIFKGTVQNREYSFAFIRRDRFGDDIFAHKSGCGQSTDWDLILRNSRVEFNLAFSYKGPVAINISLLKS